MKDEKSKSPGQIAYERDLVHQPTYQDGALRPDWDELSRLAQESWERNPTDRVTHRSGPRRKI